MLTTNPIPKTTPMVWAAISVLAVLLVVPHLVVAQDSSWVGQKVVIKYRYPVKVGDRVVDDGQEFYVFAVTRINGDWLWVVSGSIEGWLPARQVVVFDQAIDFYTQEIKVNPGNSAAWFQRGVNRGQKKEYDKAIADYSEAIRLDPTHALAYSNRGVVWSEKKQYDRAIADYSEAIRLNPNHAGLYINRSNAWSAKKEYDKALADHNKAIQLDPRSVIPGPVR